MTGGPVRRDLPIGHVTFLSEALFETIGARPPWLARMSEETLGAIRKQRDEPAVADAWEQGRGLTVDQAVELALASLVREDLAL
jgi:hypothetical protein